MLGTLLPRHVLGRHCMAAVPFRSQAASGMRAAGAKRRHCAMRPQATAADEAVAQAAELLRLTKPKTVPTRRLTKQEAIEALAASQHAKARKHYASFYSSELGGIVTDPALMVVSMDDHMVHRGHGVFDTALLIESYLYGLDQHLERFVGSARKANIPLPMSLEQMRRIILETTAASCKINGYVRYWLSAGRGGFGLSGSECVRPAFYVVVYTQDKSDEQQREYLEGWKVKTSPVPIKAPFFACVKSTNYLPNVLALMDAEADNFHQGIFVDAEGYVSEGPNMNVACLLEDGTLVVPPFNHSLAGITVQRMMELLPWATDNGLEGVARIEQRPISVDEAKSRSKEVFLIGGSLPVMPVVQWDNKLIADGTPGETTLLLRTLMKKDWVFREGSDQHTEVPYGYLTGMGL